MAEKPEKEITATLQRVVWQGNGKIIAKAFDLNHPGKTISIIGAMQNPIVGQAYRMNGKWKKNFKYNSFDFLFDSFTTIVPTERDGIVDYIARTIDGIGIKRAKKIVEVFGDESLEKIKKNPLDVAAKCDMSADVLIKGSAVLLGNEKTEKAMVETHSLLGGILGPRMIEKAVSAWGSNAPHIVRRRPYHLMELSGVGFSRADAVWLKMGLPHDAPRRQAEALLAAIDELHSETGSTRLALSHAMRKAQAMCGLEIDDCAKKMCVRARKIELFPGAGLVKEHVALSEIRRAELRIANKLVSLATQNMQTLKVDEDLLEGLEDQQAEAVRMAAKNQLMILTGGPGTGKTFTTARIVEMWTRNGLYALLAAPTGKAAKQIQNAMGNLATASTIHSMLGGRVNEDGVFRFEYGQAKSLECSAMVIDETSMLDTKLAASLMDAVPDHARVLFVGDDGQLPSIGPGAILRDMQEAGVPTTKLTKVRRNSGTIVQACIAIHTGQVPEPDKKLMLEDESPKNLIHIETQNAEETVEVIQQLTRAAEGKWKINPMWQTQTICATNVNGNTSCKVLNDALRAVLNPVAMDNYLGFGVGDKIVRTKNGKAEAVIKKVCGTCGSGYQSCEICGGCGYTFTPPDKDGDDNCTGTSIVNGDIGLVRKIQKEDGKTKIFVDFFWPDRTVCIQGDNHNLSLAYAMTCHKMQGSGVDAVFIPLSTGTFSLPMVSREWIFTAYSRAKKFMITVGSMDDMPMALSRSLLKERKTGLVELISL